ncbi:MAG TPA: thioredoxin domain-containing protein [Candidatus Dormibacteraeota bacterium]|nr:thioredoxin domain-containing protein [Candidatus Dormibacteraeota bacterium]
MTERDPADPMATDATARRPDPPSASGASTPDAETATAPSAAWADSPADPPGPPDATRAPEARSAARSALVRLGGYLLAAVLGAVLLGGLALGGAVTLPRPAPSPSPSPDRGEGPSLGQATAPVTIEVWADYQCPFCGLQARGIEPSIERSLVSTGQVRLVFRDFAFLGQESVDAAVAARCAGRQGRYFYFHDLLFGSQQGENQGAFARQRLLNLASFAGLDGTSFTACLDDAAVSNAVEAETASGRGYGVESTPTLRVSGPGGSELLDGVKPLSVVTAAVARVSRPSASSEATPGGGTGTPAAATGAPTIPGATAGSPASSATAASPAP